MSTRAYTPTDLVRAVEAAVKRGMLVERARITPQGGIEMDFAQSAALNDADLIDWRPKR